MPAGIPHAVQAVTAFKMYLVVVKTPFFIPVLAAIRSHPAHPALWDHG